MMDFMQALADKGMSFHPDRHINHVYIITKVLNENWQSGRTEQHERMLKWSNAEGRTRDYSGDNPRLLYDFVRSKHTKVKFTAATYMFASWKPQGPRWKRMQWQAVKFIFAPIAMYPCMCPKMFDIDIRRGSTL